MASVRHTGRHVAGTHEGTVEDIQMRATFIRTYDGRRVVIPNADLFTDTVVVNTAFDDQLRSTPRQVDGE